MFVIINVFYDKQSDMLRLASTWFAILAQIIQKRNPTVASLNRNACGAVAVAKYSSMLAFKTASSKFTTWRTMPEQPP